MKKLCLLFLVCAACGAKKPAAKQPAPPPPPADDQGKKPDAQPEPERAVTPGISDPCDGGQKPR